MLCLHKSLVFYSPWSCPESSPGPMRSGFRVDSTSMPEYHIAFPANYVDWAIMRDSGNICSLSCPPCLIRTQLLLGQRAGSLPCCALILVQNPFPPSLFWYQRLKSLRVDDVSISVEVGEMQCWGICTPGGFIHIMEMELHHRYKLVMHAHHSSWTSVALREKQGGKLFLYWLS